MCQWLSCVATEEENALTTTAQADGRQPASRQRIRATLPRVGFFYRGVESGMDKEPPRGSSKTQSIRLEIADEAGRKEIDVITVEFQALRLSAH